MAARALLTMRSTRSRWSLGRQPAARLVARVLCVIRQGGNLEVHNFGSTYVLLPITRKGRY